MKTVKELYDRVQEEFEIVNRMSYEKMKPDTKSAMMNVDALIDAVRNEERAKLCTTAPCQHGACKHSERHKMETQKVLIQSKNDCDDVVLFSKDQNWESEAKQMSKIWDSDVRVYFCEYSYSIKNQLKIEQDKFVKAQIKKNKAINVHKCSKKENRK